MIRMTLVLVAALFGILAVAGETPDLPQGGFDPDDVARADVSPTQLVTAADTNTTTQQLALDDEAGAVQRALQADVIDRTPDAVVQQVSLQAEPENVAPVEAPVPGAWVVTGNRVNLRDGPSTGNAIVDQVVRDQTVEVLDATNNGWKRVRVSETGVEAYIFDRFLAQR